MGEYNWLLLERKQCLGRDLVSGKTRTCVQVTRSDALIISTSITFGRKQGKVHARLYIHMKIFCLFPDFFFNFFLFYHEVVLTVYIKSSTEHCDCCKGFSPYVRTASVFRSVVFLIFIFYFYFKCANGLVIEILCIKHVDLMASLSGNPSAGWFDLAL